MGKEENLYTNMLNKVIEQRNNNLIEITKEDLKNLLKNVSETRIGLCLAANEIVAAIKLTDTNEKEERLNNALYFINEQLENKL